MPNPVFASLPTSIFQHITMLALKPRGVDPAPGFRGGQKGAVRLAEPAADSRPLLAGFGNLAA